MSVALWACACCIAAQAAAMSSLHKPARSTSTPAPAPAPVQVPDLHWEPPDARALAGPGCTYRNRTYAVGERWVTGPPEKCAKFLCEDDDQIAALTCPWFVPPPGCTVTTGDKSSPYPHCCPKKSCGRTTTRAGPDVVLTPTDGTSTDTLAPDKMTSILPVPSTTPITATVATTEKRVVSPKDLDETS